MSLMKRRVTEMSLGVAFVCPEIGRKKCYFSLVFYTGLVSPRAVGGGAIFASRYSRFGKTMSNLVSIQKI
jgi:hypothetical protein